MTSRSLLIQLRRTYLLYEHDDGVVLIDSIPRVSCTAVHAADDRRVVSRRSGLLPGRFTFSARRESLEAHQDRSSIGLELGPFRATRSSSAVPSRRFDALMCLRESLAALSGDHDATAHTGHELLVATPPEAAVNRRAAGA
jgi:DNA mismatch repair protein MutL